MGLVEKTVEVLRAFCKGIADAQLGQAIEVIFHQNRECTLDQYISDTRDH